MLQSVRAAAPCPLFLTPKSRSAIPIAGALHHDALRQLALDPAVRRIEYVAGVVLDRARVSLNALLLSRGDRCELMEIVERPAALRDLDDEGLFLLACRKLSAFPVRASRADIEREPLAKNAREVWAEHDRVVTLHARLQIAEAIETHGPTPLGRLCEGIGGDAHHDVYGLACQNVLALDLHGRLDHAIVSAGGAGFGCLTATTSHSMEAAHER